MEEGLPMTWMGFCIYAPGTEMKVTKLLVDVLADQDAMVTK